MEENVLSQQLSLEAVCSLDTPYKAVDAILDCATEWKGAKLGSQINTAAMCFMLVWDQKSGQQGQH